MKHPTREECEKLLTEYETPEHVKGHCRAVADTALTIAKALNEKGLALYLELILSAGMLHDIARVEEEHGIVGAELMDRLGYKKEGKIIRAHMRYEFSTEDEPITETDLVCLGDRLVMEDAYVGLDKRIDYIIKKIERQGKTDVKPIILEKKKLTQDFIHRIESIVGCSIDSLMKNKTEG